LVLYKRASLILLTLVNTDRPITISYLQSLTKASDRSIRYDLDNIDQFLKSKGLKPIERVPGTGIFFVGDKDERAQVKRLLKDVDIYNYVPSPKERKVLIILEFIMAPNYITTDYLAEILDVSRNTINSDLKGVKEELDKYKLKLKFKQRYGLILEGAEANIRKLLVEMIIKHLFNLSANGSKISEGISNLVSNRIKELVIGEIDIRFLEGIVNGIEEELGFDYSDLAYENILTHLIVSIVRTKAGNYISINSFNIEVIKETREFKIIKNIKVLFEDLYKITVTDSELAFITTSLLGGNFSTNQNITKGDWVFIQIMVRNFIEEVNSKLMVDISKDWRLYNSLLAHIKPMLNRIRYGIRLENPLIKSIKKNYKGLYKIVEESVYELEQFIGKEMSQDEIGYLTLHFGGAIERTKLSSSYKPRVLIVCETGLGTSELLMIQIQSLFDLNIVGVTSRRKLEETLKDKHIDAIISTIAIKVQEDIEVLEVRAILSDEDIRNLNSLFYKFRKTNIEIKGLISLVERYATIHDYKNLEKDLHNLFNIKSMWDSNIGDRPNLLDTISRNTIQLQSDITDWEEAVRLGGELLLKAGAVEERYIEAMVSTVKKYGGYIIVSPKAAMPHAKPRDGAKKTKMSMVTFKESIRFENAEDIDIRLIICLSTTNSTSHLKALSQLMVLLEDEEAVEALINADSKNEVINIIAKYSY